jgi:hypothetical protein
MKVNRTVMWKWKSKNKNEREKIKIKNVDLYLDSKGLDDIPKLKNFIQKVHDEIGFGVWTNVTRPSKHKLLTHYVLLHPWLKQHQQAKPNLFSIFTKNDFQSIPKTQKKIALFLAMGRHWIVS